MSPRCRWFAWRFVASALLMSISLYLFLLNGSFGFLLIGFWLIAAVCFGAAIVIWFYRHPDDYSEHDEKISRGPQTEHEMAQELDRSKQAELNRIGLSGYWMDRHYFGRFRGPRG